MKYKGITHYKKQDKSPFIEELFDIEVSTRKRIMAGNKPSSIMVNSDTGELEANQVFAVKETVDRQTYTKIFSGMMREIFNLSSRGVRVFSYITSISKPNKDVVMFDMEEALEFTKYKKEQSILHGIEELLSHDIIARTKKHYKYYINPNLFFNGSRLTLIKQYQKDDRLKPPTNHIETLRVDQLPPSGDLK